MEDVTIPPDFAFRFAAIVPTRWVDGDVQGVLNNAVYSTLLEEGRHAYFGELDLLEGGHFPFLLAQSNLCFRSPGYGGRRVRVELATVHLGRSSFEQLYRLREAAAGSSSRGDDPVNGASGPVWCEARARLVCYDPDTGRSRAMDEVFRQRIARFEGLE